MTWALRQTCGTQSMSEKPESEEFDEEEDDGGAVESEDLDVDHLIADIDKRKKNVVKPGEPAWRRLERIREERETAAQLSDFDDYEIGLDADGDSEEESLDDDEEK
jgi:hypothetical protein